MSTKGNFSCKCCEHDRPKLESMYKAVTLAEAWEWLKNFDQMSLLWSGDPMIEKILKLDTNNFNYSGSSFVCYLRIMEFIAKKGWDAYAELHPPILPQNMNHPAQLEGFRTQIENMF